MAYGALATFLLLAAALPSVQAAEIQGTTSAATAANPIRKVVNMLESMTKKVSEEGEREKSLYEKFMCYCRSSKGDLGASIAANGEKMSALPSNIEALQEQKQQDEAALKQAQLDRSAAKEAMAEAMAMREKEAAAFADTKAEYSADIQAIVSATSAVEKGMSGAFLQTDQAQVLKRLVDGKQDMDDETRDMVVAFISGGQGAAYAPSSGQITGILKQLGGDMGDSLTAATKAEEAAITTHQALMAAKTKEVNACTAAIEAKTMSIGELGIDIVEAKNDLKEAEAAHAEDTKFLGDMDKTCATKTAEWEVVVQTRSQELAALADTIKLLSDDDALELFKKTLPGASASLLQVGARGLGVHVRKQAAGMLNKADSRHRAQFDLIALALTGKKVSFAKVLTMIDDMVNVLKDEQNDDEHKKEYCAMQFDFTDDKKKDLERTLSLEASSIEKAKEAIATLTEEIAALAAGIKALDKSVAEAAEQRKEENEDYTALMAADSAAKELIGMAKNRMNKFYQPKLYAAPAKEELSAEGRIQASFSLAQVSAHSQLRDLDAPAPPPASVGAYKQKGEESTGVIAMMDLLIADMDKEMTEAETTEKEAQKDYEAMTRDAAEKRAQDSKALSDKEGWKAQAEGDLQEHSSAQKAAQKEHQATLEYETNLHTSCDWLLKYFDMRKEARNGEIDSLKQAKSVLSGSDYSLLQRGSNGTRTKAVQAAAGNATMRGGLVLKHSAQQHMEVQLGPFASAADACDYCFGSFTKEGDAPAGPVAPACVCMAYPEGTEHNMFCATPASAADFIKDKGGCRCKARDMEAMGATTCTPL